MQILENAPITLILLHDFDVWKNIFNEALGIIETKSGVILNKDSLRIVPRNEFFEEPGIFNYGGTANSLNRVVIDNLNYFKPYTKKFDGTINNTYVISMCTGLFSPDEISPLGSFTNFHDANFTKNFKTDMTLYMETQQGLPYTKRTCIGIENLYGTDTTVRGITLLEDHSVGIIKEDISECNSYTDMYQLRELFDERVKLAVSVLQTFFTLLIK